MSFARKILSAIGKLGVVLLLLGAFVVGLGGVMLLSLRSPEMKVPQVVGKEFLEGEKELAQFDLKIRKRSDRFSQEKPNTILEQYPLPGETLKAGQTVAVIVSRAEAIGDEKPAEVKKETVQDKPKPTDEQSEVDKARQKRKANKNANANKPATTDADGNFNGNANAKQNSNAGNTNGGNSNGANNANARTNSNGRTNNNGNNANSRPTNSNSANRSSTPAGNRNSSPRTGETNRRNQ